MQRTRQPLARLAPGLLASFALGATAPAPAAVFLSEYVEGSGSNKALEVFNSGPGAVDLSGFEVRLFANGSPTATGTLSLAGRSLLPGATLVLAHPSASPALLGFAQVTSGILNFNGDDALGLFADGVLLDAIGQAGVDPGDAWISATHATRDMTLRRLPSTLAGDADLWDAFDPAREWQALSMDTFNGLGAHAVVPTPAPLPPAFLLLGSALGGLGLLGRARGAAAPAAAG